MLDLNLQPTPGSGNGWILKEDGQSENIIAQLKSTDFSEISIKLLDIQKLEENAAISHKRPVFVIQFLKTQDIFILVRPEQDIMNQLHKRIENDRIDLKDSDEQEEKPKIKSVSHKNRDSFYNEKEIAYNEKSKNMREVRRAYNKAKSKYNAEY